MGNFPSLAVLRDAMDVLKKHYPHRFAGMYIIHPGMLFQWLWRALKPLVPKKVLLKCFVLSNHETRQILEDHVGLERLDIRLGGQIDHSLLTNHHYLVK